MKETNTHDLTRRMLLRYAGHAALAASAGCSMWRSDSATSLSPPTPRMYSFHPMKDGIPAKGHSMTYLIVGDDGATFRTLGHDCSSPLPSANHRVESAHRLAWFFHAPQ